MNYYIQGDPARADKIKAAFEKLGIDALDFGFADKTLVYCSIGGCGGCVQSLPYSINLMHILHSHPDYKELELELPAQPNFKVGDWLVSDGENLYQLIDISDGRYKLVDMHMKVFDVPFSFDSSLRKWTIADAKDGDVLATDNGWTCIFKAFDGCVFSSYCFMDSEKWFYRVGSNAHTLDIRINGKLHPATKEQRDLLFSRMKELGCEWDADKKELKKFPKHYDISNFNPFDKVLVRDTKNGTWKANFFSRYRNEKDDRIVARFLCVESIWIQCIPYDGNEHLLGTTDPCDEFYINW